MKNKRIDEIINAAFGEHEGDLGQMSGQERRDLAQAQAIKQGLEALKDVPEHQLSNERLRNAILGTAVTQRRTPVWGYATAAAAFVVVGFVAFQSAFTGQTGPEVAKSESGHEVGNGIADPGTDSLLGNTSTGSEGQSNIKGNETIVAANTTVDTSPNLGYTALDTVALGPEYRENMADGIAPVIQNASLSEGASIEPASMPGPIVLVEPGDTTPNGAAAAREVTSYGNVVFGG